MRYDQRVPRLVRLVYVSYLAQPASQQSDPLDRRERPCPVHYRKAPASDSASPRLCHRWPTESSECKWMGRNEQNRFEEHSAVPQLTINGVLAGLVMVKGLSHEFGDLFRALEIAAY